jgi:hypothetical protein
METNMTAGEAAEIPEGEEGGAPDMSLVQRRVHELVRVLSKFKELRDPTMSRQDYVDRLKRNLATYYGYNDYFLDLVRRELPTLPPLWIPITTLSRDGVSRAYFAKRTALCTKRHTIISSSRSSITQ